MANFMTRLGLALGFANKAKAEREKADRENRLIDLQGQKLQQEMDQFKQEQAAKDLKNQYEFVPKDTFGRQAIRTAALPEATVAANQGATAGMNASFAGIPGAPMLGGTTKALVESLGIGPMTAKIPTTSPSDMMTQKTADDLAQEDAKQANAFEYATRLKAVPSADTTNTNTSRELISKNSLKQTKELSRIPTGSAKLAAQTSTSNTGARLAQGLKLAEARAKQDQINRLTPTAADNLRAATSMAENNARIEAENTRRATEAKAKQAGASEAQVNALGRIAFQKALNVMFPARPASSAAPKTPQPVLDQRSFGKAKGKAMVRDYLAMHNNPLNRAQQFDAPLAGPAAVAGNITADPEYEAFGRLFSGEGQPQDGDFLLQQFQKKGNAPADIEKFFATMPDSAKATLSPAVIQFLKDAEAQTLAP